MALKACSDWLVKLRLSFAIRHHHHRYHHHHHHHHHHHRHHRHLHHHILQLVIFKDFTTSACIRLTFFFTIDI